MKILKRFNQLANYIKEESASRLKNKLVWENILKFTINQQCDSQIQSFWNKERLIRVVQEFERGTGRELKQ